MSAIDHAPSLRFLGAAGTVTGSKFLLEFDRHKVLIDCGLFQGLKPLRLRNWQPWPDGVGSIDAVVLTHAHIDHSGYLPRLHKLGYRGPVHATRGTGALLEILLPDSAYLQMEEAEDANRKGYSKHRPALPLYDEGDAAAVLDRIRTHGYREAIPLPDGAEFQFIPSGHLLGSASVLIGWGLGDRRRTLLVSGDLGKYDDPFMADPQPPGGPVDYLVIESTYGDRKHGDRDVLSALAEAVRSTFEAGGVLLIPAFAVGRTQEVLFHLSRLEHQGRIPAVEVYVDSPMAVDATDLYRSFVEELNFDWDEAPHPLTTRFTRFMRTRDQSRDIRRVSSRAIVLSSSGMATGGRVLHHLTQRLGDPRNTVLFAGHQVEGTRGRALVEGARSVRIHGRDWPVRARILHLGGFSAHADRDDLLRWAGALGAPPRRTFVVHGEKPASAALRDLLENRLGHRAVAPDADSAYPLP